MRELLVFILAISFVHQSQDQPTIPKELLGVWQLESSSTKGEIASKTEVPIWLVIMENGDFVVKGPNFMFGGTVVVDPKASTPAIDFRTTMSTARTQWTDIAVYEFNEGVLTIAKAIKGSDRPTSVKLQSTSEVQVYHRATTDTSVNNQNETSNLSNEFPKTQSTPRKNER